MSRGANVIIHQIIVDLVMNSTPHFRKVLGGFQNIINANDIHISLKIPWEFFKCYQWPFHPRLHFFFSLNIWLNAIIVLKDSFHVG
jgi:hypothetical protein